MPRENRVWHDSLPIQTNEVRIYNAWTHPEYRNQGLISNIIKNALYRLKERGYSFITVVIEDSNHFSKRAFKKLGFKPYKKNILIKFNGKNIISTLGLGKFYLLYGERKNKL